MGDDETKSENNQETGYNTVIPFNKVKASKDSKKDDKNLIEK